MSTEVSGPRRTTPAADSERGLLLLVLAMVVFGVAGIFAVSA